jgi:crotonobetaine/carnitine-CoA ligase
VPWHSSLGYYKELEQTLQSRCHEWFHTGDRGYLDDDGYFWFVDRAKDAIRRLGENISSFEVEQFAGRHPAVAEIAAYPLAADKSEQEVAVSVVLKANAAFHPRDLVRFCMNTMPKFMVPRFVHVADSLPRNLNQRVEKYKLREWAEQNRAALWDRESEAEFRRAPAALDTRAAHR